MSFDSFSDFSMSSSRSLIIYSEVNPTTRRLPTTDRPSTINFTLEDSDKVILPAVYHLIVCWIGNNDMTHWRRFASHTMMFPDFDFLPLLVVVLCRCCLLVVFSTTTVDPAGRPFRRSTEKVIKRNNLLWEFYSLWNCICLVALGVGGSPPLSKWTMFWSSL